MNFFSNGTSGPANETIGLLKKRETRYIRIIVTIVLIVSFDLFSG